MGHTVDDEVWWPTGADLGQGPLGNIGLEGFAGVVVEEAHAEGGEALIRALVYVGPVIQKEVDNVPVGMHLGSDKVRLVNTGTGPQQDTRRTTWHPCCPSEGGTIEGQATRVLGLGEAASVRWRNEWIRPSLVPFAFT